VKEAPSEIVALYKYVLKADRPVSFEEIVENALPPQMRSASYRAYAEHRDKEVGEVLPDAYWEIEANKDLAWRWWVGELVRASVHAKRLSVSAEGGGPATAKRRESSLYSPGLHAPQVKYPDGKIRPWTVELDAEYEKAVAGQRVVQRAEEALKRLAPLDKKDRDYVAAVIKDAVRAVKVT
jgi:hypothetical protein